MAAAAELAYVAGLGGLTQLWKMHPDFLGAAGVLDLQPAQAAGEATRGAFDRYFEGRRARANAKLNARSGSASLGRRGGGVSMAGYANAPPNYAPPNYAPPNYAPPSLLNASPARLNASPARLNASPARLNAPRATAQPGVASMGNTLAEQQRLSAADVAVARGLGAARAAPPLSESRRRMVFETLVAQGSSPAEAAAFVASPPAPSTTSGASFRRSASLGASSARRSASLGASSARRSNASAPSDTPEAMHEQLVEIAQAHAQTARRTEVAIEQYARALAGSTSGPLPSGITDGVRGVLEANQAQYAAAGTVYRTASKYGEAALSACEKDSAGAAAAACELGEAYMKVALEAYEVMNGAAGTYDKAAKALSEMEIVGSRLSPSNAAARRAATTKLLHNHAPNFKDERNASKLVTVSTVQDRRVVRPEREVHKAQLDKNIAEAEAALAAAEAQLRKAEAVGGSNAANARAKAAVHAAGIKAKRAAGDLQWLRTAAQTNLNSSTRGMWNAATVVR